jgi:hypothetical protein
MNELLSGLYDAHRLLLVLAAVAYFAYWTRTHFWMPRYAHLLAGGGVLVGIALLLMTPADAPIHHEPLGWVKKGAMVAVFPALVYFFFIFYGGQRAAFDRAQACAQCGAEHRPDGACQERWPPASR